MRTKRFALGAAAAAVMTIALATPVFAAESDVFLKDEHKNVTAVGWTGEKKCDGPFSDILPTADGWHFLLPDSSGTSFTSATITFKKPDNTVVVVTITSRNEAAPNTDPAGWTGFIDKAGSNWKHVWIETPAGWTLVDGAGKVEFSGQFNVFNLSHVCVGKDKPSTSPSPSNPSTETPGTSTSASSSTPPGGNLPQTGFPVAALVSTAALMLVAGAALLAVRRRRDIREEV